MACATEVLLSDVLEVFKCVSCTTAPMLPPVYCCRLGHSTCVGCRHTACNQCGEGLSGRNLPLEEVLLAAMYGGDLEETCCSSDTDVDVLNRLTDVVNRDCHLQMLSCGRTVPCPFPCTTKVTTPGLYRHFGFQHPEVFLGMLCKNQPCTVTIPYELIAALDEKCNTHCVYIFVVDIGDGAQREEDKLMALNSMNAAELLNISHSLWYMLRRQKYLAMLSVSRLNTGAVDTFAAWVTSLYDFSLVSYTLSYNCCNTYSLSYQGRPKTLQSPVDAASASGDCLVLPSGLLGRNLCSGGLDLTVTFHLDLPFPQGHPVERETDVEPEPPLCTTTVTQ